MSRAVCTGRSLVARTGFTCSKINDLEESPLVNWANLEGIAAGVKVSVVRLPGNDIEQE